MFESVLFCGKKGLKTGFVVYLMFIAEKMEEAGTGGMFYELF